MRERERERITKREKADGEQEWINESLNVIVMEKLLNLSLMPAYGTCVKSIAFKRFIELNSRESNE